MHDYFEPRQLTEEEIKEHQKYVMMENTRIGLFLGFLIADADPRNLTYQENDYDLKICNMLGEDQEALVRMSSEGITWIGHPLDRIQKLHNLLWKI